MQRKMRRFTLCSIALTTAVTRVEDLHKLYCDRSTSYVLEHDVLKFQLYCSNDVGMVTTFRVFLDHPSYIQKINNNLYKNS